MELNQFLGTRRTAVVSEAERKGEVLMANINGRMQITNRAAVIDRDRNSFLRAKFTWPLVSQDDDEMTLREFAEDNK